MPLKKVDEIIEKLKNLKPEIEKRYKITEIGVFGSYVRNEQTENSDLDILVDYEKGMTLFSFCELENWLSDIFGVKVDLVMKKGLKPRIGKQILSEVVYL
jgi:predicted nucleotidyltransferase